MKSTASIRRACTFNTSRVDHLYVDSHDPSASLFCTTANSAMLINDSLIYDIQPQELYHLGAQSHVRVSFDMPEYTGDVTGLGTTRLLQAIHAAASRPDSIKPLVARCLVPPRRLSVNAQLSSPRACMPRPKLYALLDGGELPRWHKLFACNGLLFNPRKPTPRRNLCNAEGNAAVARILAGQQHKLYLGNPEAQRDWGTRLNTLRP